ncbi:hypothetical protein YC2023_090465 [Brassica napus]
MHSMELFDEIQNVKWFGALSVLTLGPSSDSSGNLWGGTFLISLMPPRLRFMQDGMVRDPSRADSKVPPGWIINSPLEITVGIKEDTVVRLGLYPLVRNKNQKLLMVSATR